MQYIIVNNAVHIYSTNILTVIQYELLTLINLIVSIYIFKQLLDQYLSVHEVYSLLLSKHKCLIDLREINHITYLVQYIGTILS